MKYCEIITESIGTKELYQTTYPAVLDAFKNVAKKVGLEKKEGEYWMGDVITAVQDTLEPIFKDEIGGKLDAITDNLFFVVKVSDAEHVGGGIRSPGNGNLIVTMEMPKKWFDSSPNMFFYIIRDNGKRMANELTASFIHEILHLEQKFRRGFIGAGSADPDGTKYLSHPDEIEAQAVNTALELIHWAGGDAAKALSWFRKSTTESMKNLGMGISPHLGSAFHNLRKQNPRAWNRYLKAVVRCLGEHANQ